MGSFSLLPPDRWEQRTVSSPPRHRGAENRSEDFLACEFLCVSV